MSNTVIDIILSIPIAVLYQISINQLGTMLIINSDNNKRIQKLLLYSFIIFIVSLILVNKIFTDGTIFENKAIKYGLIFGACLAMLNNLLSNWHLFDNDVKLFIYVSFLLTFVYSSYKLREI